MKTVVIPFHAGDQKSAQLVIENILSLESGMDSDLEFRLQFDSSHSTCEILDTVDRLNARFPVQFLERLPEIPVPREFRDNDPNGPRIDERHTVRTKETKERIFCWNRAVFGAIRNLDFFVVIEPDCVILKDGWAKAIFDASSAGLRAFPIFGHLKTGLIGGRQVPTHYAGCSVYDGARLRELIDESVFQVRYDNPWWPLRWEEPTELAGNCYWGPAFSGYDISFDYFLYAHLQRQRSGHGRPLDWTTSDLSDGRDVIRCEFRSRRSTDSIIGEHFGRLPVLHGVKDDAARHVVIKKARRGVEVPAYPLSGKYLAPPIDRARPVDAATKPSIGAGFGVANDRLATLQTLKDQFHGERCFIIANGPSLRVTDLKPLRNEFTIGLNRINLNFENMGFEPTFLCCVNKNVIEQFTEDFDRTSSIKLLTSHALGRVKNNWNTFFMKSLPRVEYFEKDLRNGAWCEGWTVTYCALQLAYFAGFKEVFLVGLDHFFGDTGTPNAAVTAEKADENHFHPDYFGKGVVWQYPDLARSEQHYRVARKVFESDGRAILDATINGRCEIFDKIDYCTLLLSAAGSPRSGIGASPSISVIVPFKNTEKHIEEAIRSILSQSAPGLEILCVNDGSEDRSAEIVRKLASAHPEIRLLANKGAGVSAARNTGLAGAAGVFAAFLDADDKFVAGSLRARLAEFDADERLQLVHGEATIINDAGEDLGLRLGQKRDLAFADAWTNPAHLNTIMARRKFLGEIKFDESMSNGEDWKFFATLLRTGAQSKYVADGGAYWRFWGNSTTSKGLLAHFDNLSGVMEWLTSPSRDPRTAPENIQGVPGKTYEDLASQVCRRKFIFCLLSGDIGGAQAHIDAVKADSVRRDHDDRFWRSVVEFSGARHFGVSPANLRRIDAAARQLIFRTADEMNLRAEMPALASAMAGVFALPAAQSAAKIDARAGDEAFRALRGKLINEVPSRSQASAPADRMALPAAISGLTEPPPRADLADMSRADSANVDETAAVAKLLETLHGPQHVMLDVGAHFGSSAAYFDRLGWTIHCFEPDPANREKLVARFGVSGNVSIDKRAVSDKRAIGVSFFSSEESTGISGLHAFRDTHRESARVDVTMIADIVAEKGLERIDFLKIDVEGFDFAVLNGVPWDRLTPDAIECEFEDAKTLPLGHNWRDIAEFLRGKGYTVYISEWHPIIRYGIRHDWRRVIPFDGAEIPADAWGNILAFRKDPGLAAVRAAFAAVMKLQKPTVGLAAPSSNASPNATGAPLVRPTAAPNAKRTVESGAPAGVMPSARTAAPAPVQPSEAKMAKAVPDTAAGGRETPYKAFAHGVREVSPQAYALLRFAKKTLAGLWRRRAFTLPVVALFAAWIGAGFAPAVAPWRLLIWSVAAFVALAGALAIVAFRVRQFTEALAAENSALRHDLAAIRDRSARQEEVSARLSASSELAKAAAAREAAASQRIDSELRALRGEVDAQGQRVNGLDQAIAGLETSMTAAGEQSVKALAALRAGVAADVGAASARSAKEVTALRTDVAADFEAASTRSAKELMALRADLGAFNQRYGGIDEAIATLDERIRESDALAKSAKETAERAAIEAPPNNAALYQRFNRRLTAAHFEEIEREWRRRLSIDVTLPTLGYLANRACEIEASLEGRLATSIEDVLLRTLVAMSVKRTAVELLEIGTLFGIGAAIMHDALASRFQHVHLTLLDPLDGYYGASQKDILTGQPVDEPTLRRNLRRAGIPDEDVTLVKRMSTELEAMEEVGRRRYDVLIIDGDHSYAGVKTDFDNYARFLRVGGYVIFDDYGAPEWPDVARFVDAEVAGRAEFAHVATSWRTCVYRATGPASFAE